MFMRIENWSLIERGHGFCLQGQVQGHRVLGNTPEGMVTKTSILRRYCFETQAVVTHSGSHYVLGEPDPRYEAAFPDARNRLIKSLKIETPIGTFGRN